MIQLDEQTYILRHCFSKTKLFSFFQNSKPYFVLFFLLNKVHSQSDLGHLILLAADGQLQIVKYGNEELRTPVQVCRGSNFQMVTVRRLQVLLRRKRWEIQITQFCSFYG